MDRKLVVQLLCADGIDPDVIVAKDILFQHLWLVLLAQGVAYGGIMVWDWPGYQLAPGDPWTLRDGAVGVSTAQIKDSKELEAVRGASIGLCATSLRSYACCDEAGLAAAEEVELWTCEVQEYVVFC